MKLYRVKCRGMHGGIANKTAHGIAYVVADDPQLAYMALRESLDRRGLGFATERELLSIELIAEKSDYPSCGVALYVVEGEGPLQAEAERDRGEHKASEASDGQAPGIVGVDRPVRPRYWMDDRGLVLTDKWLTTSPRSTSDWRAAYHIPVRRLRGGGYALDCEYCGGNDETPPEHCTDCERPNLRL